MTGYDAKGNLTAVTRGGATTRVEYYATGEVRRTTDPDGHAADQSYDGNGNRETSVRVWTDPNNSKNTKTLVSATTYDANDRPVRVTDEHGNKTDTAYDAFGRVSKTVSFAGTAREQVSLPPVLDARGLAVESRSPDGTVTRTWYDAMGRAAVATDAFAPGQAGPVRGTRTTYDAAGRATWTERLAGVVIPVTTDARGVGTAGTPVVSGAVLSRSVTVYAADGSGRVDYAAQFVGRGASDEVLTGAGWPNAAKTQSYSDDQGRVTKTRTWTDAGWTTFTDTRTEYDRAGRAVVQWDAMDQPTFTAYDGDGRATKTTLADGTWTAVAYDADGRKASETRVAEWVGAGADKAAGTRTTDYRYDDRGRLVTVTQPAVPDPDQANTLVRPVTAYGYDPYGNRVSITDANGHVTAFTFDAFGRQRTRTLPAVAGEDPAVETTKYSDDGSEAYRIDFNGTKVETTYDWQVASPPAGSGLGLRLGRVAGVTWTLKAQTDPAETVAYTYDKLGRVDKVVETRGTGAEARETRTEYDADGRVVRVSSPEGATLGVEYTYNAETGRPESMKAAGTEVRYGYDVLGRLAAVTEWTRGGVPLAAADRLMTAYTYTPVGAVGTVTTTRNGATLKATTNTYDGVRHWLDSTETTDGGGASYGKYTYTRRADGQVVGVAEDGVRQPDGSSASGTGAFAYDALDRLESEAYTTGGATRSADYALDLVGNRRSKAVTGGADAGTTAYAYDDRDRLRTEAGPSGTITRYGYDVAGSLTTTHVDDVLQRTQVWDARGRLSGLLGPTGLPVASYRYTADGIRSRVTEGGTTTRYAIDAQSPSGYAQVVEEWRDGTTAVQAAGYVYGAGLDPLGMTRFGYDVNGVRTSTVPAQYVADGHSGVRQAVTPGGAVLLVQRFGAFGDTLAEAKVAGFVNPIGYRGERFDPTLGQYYLRARFYDPRSGRFTGVDPYMGNYGDPLQVMRYGYAGANPIASGDPSGQMSLGVTIGVGFVLGGIGGGLGYYASTPSHNRSLGGFFTAVSVGALLGAGGAYLAFYSAIAAVGLSALGLGSALWLNYDVYSNPNSSGGQQAAATVLGLLAIFGVIGARARFYQVQAAGGNVRWQSAAAQAELLITRPVPSRTPVHIPEEGSAAANRYADAKGLLFARGPATEEFAGVRVGETNFAEGLQVSVGGRFDMPPGQARLKGLWAIDEYGQVRFAPGDQGHPRLFGGNARHYAAGEIEINGNHATWNVATGRGAREPGVLTSFLRAIGYTATELPFRPDSRLAR